MRSSSYAVKLAISHGVKPYLQVKLIAANGSFQWLSDSDFIANSVKLKNETSSNDNFDVGSTIIGSFMFSLNNFQDKWKNYDFSGNKIEVYVGFDVASTDYDQFITPEDSDEYISIESDVSEPIEIDNYDSAIKTIKMGEYYLVSHKTIGNIINCEAYDKLIVMDRNDANITVSSNTTALSIVRQLASANDITLVNTSFPNSGTVISQIPTEKMTCRQLLSYVMQICGCFARMNSDGALLIGWYSFSDRTNVIGTLFGKNLHTANTIFSGIHISGDGVDYLYGNSNNSVLEIRDNPLINSSNVQSIAANIAPNIINIPFCVGDLQCLSNPLYEVGDVFVVDDNGAQRVFPATSVTYTLTLQESMRCGGQDEEVDDLRLTKLKVEENRINQKIYGVQTRLEATNNSIIAEVTRATETEGNLAARLVITENGLSTKVEKGQIISAINQSAEAISINANKLNLTGYVTIASLGAGGSTVVDGSRIKTGTVTADQLAADAVTGKIITGGEIYQTVEGASHGAVWPSGSGFNSQASILNGIVSAGQYRLNGVNILAEGADTGYQNKSGIYVDGHFSTNGTLWCGQSDTYQGLIASFRGKIEARDILLKNYGDGTKWLTDELNDMWYWIRNSSGGSTDLSAVWDAIDYICDSVGISRYIH